MEAMIVQNMVCWFAKKQINKTKKNDNFFSSYHIRNGYRYLWLTSIGIL